MSNKLPLLIYNLLLPLGLLFMLPGALRKMRRRGGRWQDLGQRIGQLPPEKRAALARMSSAGKPIWMHAVSVGEVGIATKLIQKLLKEHPATRIVLTTTTPTGHALAQETAARMPEHLLVLYSPIDARPVARRFLDLIRPAQIVLIEAEVWPNLVSIARREGIPVSVVNARLSARSERRMRRFGWFIRPVFSSLSQVLVQDPRDAPRFEGLGVAAERIHHTGSIKFDPQGAAPREGQLVELRQVLSQAGITADQPILLAASTHPGEEALMGRVFLDLRQRFPQLVLLIVPRHVERTAELMEELAPLGLGPQRRSRINANASCLIVDTTGELAAWQYLATVVVIGKSFLAEGGQNPAEAVMARKPVLFGPHMENFEALVELLLAAKGAMQVADTAALTEAIAGLLADPGTRDRIGQAGHEALHVHEGATQKTIARLFLKN